MNDDKYIQEIKKTGFILESQIAETLRRAGWTVISNKYYEDDFEGSVREIDLLAYKVSKVQHLSVYTTLLISCKKSDVDIWALLARNINLKDPNSDWWPVHAWSNDKAASYQMAQSGMPRDYHERAIKLGVKEALSVPRCEVFAFQEMNRVSGAPHNDKNIFGAVTSLMKAQAYEIGALSQRKKKPSIYQFNLLSIIESDLFRLTVDGEKISQEQIESEHYISRYIIKKSETFSRIRFIVSSCFAEKLEDYGRLHDANCKWFENSINYFYKDILEDFNRTEVLIGDFRARVWFWIHWAIKQKRSTKISADSISLSWNSEGKYAVVNLFEDESLIESLNDDVQLRTKVASVLKEVYRYDGDFRFAFDEVPF